MSSIYESYNRVERCLLLNSGYLGIVFLAQDYKQDWLDGTVEHVHFYAF